MLPALKVQYRESFPVPSTRVILERTRAFFESPEDRCFFFYAMTDANLSTIPTGSFVARLSMLGALYRAYGRSPTFSPWKIAHPNFKDAVLQISIAAQCLQPTLRPINLTSFEVIDIIDSTDRFTYPEFIAILDLALASLPLEP